MPKNDPAHPVLIAAPLGQDASAIADTLQSAGIHVSICNSLDECARCITTSTAAMVLTEEALEHAHVGALQHALASQPEWSELPIIVLARGGEGRWNRLLELTAAAPGSLMLLERPMQAATLVQTVRVALRSRRRQHQIHDLLEQQQRNVIERQNHAADLECALNERTVEVTLALQRLATAQRMAAVGTLASGLAHDMTNLLLPLSARLEMLLTHMSVDGATHDHLTAVQGLMSHLREMARNLSLFARDPEKEGVVGRTDLTDWRGKAWRFIEASIRGESGTGASSIDLRFDLDPQIPAVAIAPHRFTQVIQNLMHNARDAILVKRAASANSRDQDYRGAIALTVQRAPDTNSVIVKVIDDGQGMSEETLRRCIEPFYTTRDRSTIASGQGTGMGLSLAHQIVERAGGTMQIESKFGEGTEITLSLPLLPAD